MASQIEMAIKACVTCQLYDKTVTHSSPPAISTVFHILHGITLPLILWGLLIMHVLTVAMQLHELVIIINGLK